MGGVTDKAEKFFVLVVFVLVVQPYGDQTLTTKNCVW